MITGLRFMERNSIQVKNFSNQINLGYNLCGRILTAFLSDEKLTPSNNNVFYFLNVSMEYLRRMRTNSN